MPHILQITSSPSPYATDSFRFRSSAGQSVRARTALPSVLRFRSSADIDTFRVKMSNLEVCN